MASIDKLMKVKKQIDDSKITEASKKGELKNLFTQLEEKAECKTTKEADKLLDDLNENLDKKEDIFEKGVSTLLEAHPWGI